jgi:hypothetical protein
MRYLISIAVVLILLAALAAFTGEAELAFGAMMLVSQAAYYIGRLHERAKTTGDSSGGDQ